MNVFDAMYLLGFVLLIGFELVAILARRYGVRHQTISHKVIDWIAKKPKSRRAIVGIGLGLLLWHWTVQPF